MKKIVLSLSIFICLQAKSQILQPIDTIANNTGFQSKVRAAALNVANQFFGDSTKADYVQRFAQEILTSPQNGSWLIILSYGLQLNPGIVVINAESSVSDMEYGLLTAGLFEKYAKAKAGIITMPTPEPDAVQIEPPLLYNTGKQYEIPITYSK